MSEVASELARVKGAFSQPTLTLLHQRQAPVVITIFRAVFGRDNRPVPTARVRSLDERGHEVYTLTSHAQQALQLVKNLTRDRATLSEHRIATLLGTVRRFNAEANPDRTARVSILGAEIARLQAERDRLVDGAELGVLGEDSDFHVLGVPWLSAASLKMKKGGGKKG